MIIRNGFVRTCENGWTNMNNILHLCVKKEDEQYWIKSCVYADGRIMADSVGGPYATQEEAQEILDDEMWAKRNMYDIREELKEKEEHIDTMTVGELIEVLNRYRKDMKVMTTWESTVNRIKEELIYVASTGTLYIDADEGFYKESFKRPT